MSAPDGAGSPAGPLKRDWDADFKRGDWDFLSGIAEAPRNCVVAGYVHRLVGAGHVLDVGCGEGVLLDYFDLSRIAYSGIDVSRTALDRARRRARGNAVDLFLSSMDEFEPQDGERFDIVIFDESISHSVHPIETLNRYLGMLNPGGFLILSQFQTFKPGSDASRFVPMLQAEIDQGRLKATNTAEVTNCETGVRWRVYCFPAVEA